MTKRALTGIKPTGIPHVGNYVGAIRPALALTGDYDAYYFIADYHALTTVTDPAELAALTYEVAAAWLAMGLDPEKVTFYRQSDVPEVFELSWLLGCVAPKGLMNRAHAYKAIVADAERQGKRDVDAAVNMGVYSYPVLMAADIVLMSSDVVPVGQDQAQHVEIARDLAEKFNHTYGDVLTVPDVSIRPTAATILGKDGRKMSKSYGNVLPLFAETDDLLAVIRRFKTDSTAPDEPKDPESTGLFQIYREIAAPGDTEKIKDALEGGRMSWKELKDATFELLDTFLTEPRRRYRELMADKGEIRRHLLAGAEKARPEAVDLLARARAAIGRENYER